MVQVVFRNRRRSFADPLENLRRRHLPVGQYYVYNHFDPHHTRAYINRNQFSPLGIPQRRLRRLTRFAVNSKERSPAKSIGTAHIPGTTSNGKTVHRLLHLR